MTMIEERARMNGVDVATLFATLDAVKETPEIAKFQFRASRGRFTEGRLAIVAMTRTQTATGATSNAGAPAPKEGDTR